MNRDPRENHHFVSRVPEGDNRDRLVCQDCGWIHYENPKVVVGAVCSWEDRVLLCERAIPPRKGYWTIPAGFLEEGETPEQGAVRETDEEATARIEIDSLLGVYAVPRISQVQLIYRARLVSPDVAAGPESAAVRLAAWDEIPWDDLAFPTVRWALLHFRQVRGRTDFQPFGTPPDELHHLQPAD